MKIKPIIFKAEMVRAILAGKKTQTRRIIKPIKEVCGYKGNKYIDGEPPSYPITGVIGDSLGTEYWNFYVGNLEGLVKCPYGKIGDGLWVRETFGFTRQCDDVNHNEDIIAYKAGFPWHCSFKSDNKLRKCKNGELMEPNHHCDCPEKWKPSIHMPRWASRITLEITNIRVERIQDITEKDAKAEGVRYDVKGFRYAFERLWDKINKSRGFGWDKNPWVWVVEFKKIKICHECSN